MFTTVHFLMNEPKNIQLKLREKDDMIEQRDELLLKAKAAIESLKAEVSRLRRERADNYTTSTETREMEFLNLTREIKSLRSHVAESERILFEKDEQLNSYKLKQVLNQTITSMLII